MAYYLTNLLQDMYSSLGQMDVTTATGGSTTTFVDTKLAGLYNDDDLNGWTLFVIRDAGGLGASPEGQFTRITDYVASTTTSTIATLPTGIAAGDTIGYVKILYPLYTMIEVINRALRSLGVIEYVDTASIVPVAGQTEYTLPAVMKYERPVRVSVNTNVSDRNDNQWYDILDYEIQYSVPGENGKLIFKDPPPSGHLVRVVYRTVHPFLTAYNSPVSENIHPTLATAAAAEKALEWQNSRLSGSDEFFLQRWNDAKRHLMDAKQEYPIRMSKPKPKVFGISRGQYIVDTSHDPNY